MKKFIKNKIVYMISGAVMFPFILILLLNIGNFLAAKYNQNINPTNIGNVEWFLFFGSYLGGVSTLIAFILTIQSNKRSLKYQEDMRKISEEGKFLANLISDLEPREIYDIYDKFKAIPKDGIDDSFNDISKILNLILDKRKKLRVNDLSLRISSDIYNKFCENCKNISSCNTGMQSKAFILNYEKIYKDLYEALGSYHEDLSLRKKIFENLNQIAIYNEKINENMLDLQGIENTLSRGQLIGQDKVLLNERKELLEKFIFQMKENTIFLQNELNEIPNKKEQLQPKILSFFEKIFEYEEKEISNLLNIVQFYMRSKRETAENKLRGNKISTFEEIK